VNGGVVVDTSVWIDWFAGRSVPPLEEALSQGLVVLAPLVVAELIAGARHSRERLALRELLERFALQETPLDHWIRVGEWRRALKDKGLSVSTPDAHVAQCALDRGALLLSRDTVFARIARVSSLRLHRSSLLQ